MGRTLGPELCVIFNMKKTWKHKLKEKVRKASRVSNQLSSLGNAITNVQKVTPLSMIGLATAAFSTISSVLPEEMVDLDGWRELNLTYETKQIFEAAFKRLFILEKTEVVGAWTVETWEYQDIVVRSVGSDKRSPDYYVRDADAANEIERLDKVISETIWRYFGTRIEVRVNKTSGVETLKLMAPVVDDDEYITSSEFDYVKDVLTDYKEDGTAIAMILHGPPGTGKSSIVKMLLHETPWLAVRVSGEATKDYLWEIIWVLDLLKPDLVIMDDLDRSIKQNYDFLEFLETVRKVTPIIVSTMNVIGKVDPVFIRPDRFDHEVPVTRLPDEVFVKLTENIPKEWHEQIREWPAAFIHEFDRRVRVRKGKDPLEDYYQELSLRLERQKKVYS